MCGTRRDARIQHNLPNALGGTSTSSMGKLRPVGVQLGSVKRFTPQHVRLRGRGQHSRVREHAYHQPLIQHLHTRPSLLFITHMELPKGLSAVKAMACRCVRQFR